MATLQELQAMGAKQVNTNQPQSGGFTLQQLQSMGAKSVSEMQSGSGMANAGSPQQAQTDSQPSFDYIKDLTGAGGSAVQQPDGILSSIAQNTIGSRGLAGVAQMPGRVAGAVSEYGPGGAQQGLQLNQSAGGNYDQGMQMIQKAKQTTDPTLHKKYIDLAVALLKNGQGLQASANDINSQTDITSGQALGTGVNAALAVAPFVASPVTATGQVLNATRGAQIASTGASSITPLAVSAAKLGVGATEAAGYGGASQVAQNLIQGNPVGQDVGKSALFSAAIPVVGKGLSTATNALRGGAMTSAEGIINRIIKPAAKDLGYGKEPAQGILNEGITANSLGDLKTKVSTRLNEIGQTIGTVGNQIETQLGKSLNYTSALKPIDDAMVEAAKLNNPTLLSSLNRVKEALSTDLKLGMVDGTPTIVKGEAKNLSQAGYADGIKLLEDVSKQVKWTGNPSDDKALNVAVQNVYRSIRGIQNEAADEAGPRVGAAIRDLNKRYGDLSAAQQAIAHREIVAQRNNLFNLSSKIGFGVGVAVPVTTAIVTGDYVLAGKILLAEIGGTAVAKVGGSTAVQTRIAGFLSALGPVERRGILNSSPIIKDIYNRVTGGETPSAEAPTTKTLGAVESVGNKMQSLITGMNPSTVNELLPFFQLGQKAASRAGKEAEYQQFLDALKAPNK